MGHWERIRVPWHETRILNCSFCGRMIPRDIWVSGDQTSATPYCSEKCERLSIERLGDPIVAAPTSEGNAS